MEIKQRLREIPNGWRAGQFVFNFLEWLHTEKGYPTDGDNRMADPFHISTDEWIKLHDEYYEYLAKQ